MAWTVVKYLEGKLKELEDGMKESGPAARHNFEEQLAAVEQGIEQLEQQETELVCQAH